jgi:hypothetical protein
VGDVGDVVGNNEKGKEGREWKGPDMSDVPDESMRQV